MPLPQPRFRSGPPVRRSKAPPFLRLALVLSAAAFALTPPPALVVERWYANGLYPPLQAALTAASNRTAVAVFDLALAGLAAAVSLVWGLAAYQARRERSFRPVGRALVRTIVLAAAVYLWFLVAWGFNYARPPIEARIGVREASVDSGAVAALARRAAAELNESRERAYRTGFPGPFATPPRLAAALEEVEREHGRPRPTVVSRPKRTMLAGFFRAAGVDGLLAPLALETLLNPDLTPPERPFALAHEWAHLSGHADEADAHLVAWLVTTRADDASRYSGWLFVVHEAASQLPPAARAEVLDLLADGPRADLAAIAARLRTRVDVVQRASWRAYDRYLKAQGIRDGVQSYSRGLVLIVRYAMP